MSKTAVMALGFPVMFGTFRVAHVPLTNSVQRYLPAVTVESQLLCETSGADRILACSVWYTVGI